MKLRAIPMSENHIVIGAIDHPYEIWKT